MLHSVKPFTYSLHVFLVVLLYQLHQVGLPLEHVSLNAGAVALECGVGAVYVAGQVPQHGEVAESLFPQRSDLPQKSLLGLMRQAVLPGEASGGEVGGYRGRRHHLVVRRRGHLRRHADLTVPVGM